MDNIFWRRAVTGSRHEHSFVTVGALLFLCLLCNQPCTPYRGRPHTDSTVGKETVYKGPRRSDPLVEPASPSAHFRDMGLRHNYHFEVNIHDHRSYMCYSEGFAVASWSGSCATERAHTLQRDASKHMKI